MAEPAVAHPTARSAPNRIRPSAHREELLLATADDRPIAAAFAPSFTDHPNEIIDSKRMPSLLMAPVPRTCRSSRRFANANYDALATHSQ
jgi:hypothetical protein